jgi:hypothetical protein
MKAVLFVFFGPLLLGTLANVGWALKEQPTATAIPIFITFPSILISKIERMIDGGNFESHAWEAQMWPDRKATAKQIYRAPTILCVNGC